MLKKDSKQLHFKLWLFINLQQLNVELHQDGKSYKN